MRNKALTGILLIGIILLSGCVEENCDVLEESIRQRIEDLNYCEVDSDCTTTSFGCPFGCYNFVNKDADLGDVRSLVELYYQGCPICRYKCGGVPSSLICKTNKCVPKPLDKVTIATDKTVYEQGETVKITVNNSLDKSVWYHDAELCGAFPWWGFLKFESDTWKKLEIHKPVENECLFCVREPSPPEAFIRELKPDSTIIDIWLLKNCERISPAGNELRLTDIETGVYRISFTYGSNKDDYAEKTVYSNEFTIQGKNESKVPQDRESCEARGGVWGRIGLFPEEVCNLPTSDSGEECSGSGECEGSCIAELSEEEWDKAINGVVYANGKCTPWRITVGCHAFVEDGKVEGILCVD